MLRIKLRSLPCKQVLLTPQPLLLPLSFCFNPGVFCLSLFSPLRCHYILSSLFQQYAVLSAHFLSYYSCLIFLPMHVRISHLLSLFPEYSKLFIFYCLVSGEKSIALMKGTSVHAHCELEWRGELILPLLCSRHCFCPGYYPFSERSSFLLDGGDSSILWAFSLCHLKARISIMLENG